MIEASIPGVSRDNGMRSMQAVVLACPKRTVRRRLPAILFCSLFPALIANTANAQSATSIPTGATPNAAPAASAQNATAAKPIRSANRRRAAKLYLTASKLFEKGEFEEAMNRYRQAAELDPGNPDYALAANVARGHLVTTLIQAAAKSRIQGDEVAARASLAHARELDPENPQVREHLNELADDAVRGMTAPLYQQGAETVGEGAVLAPQPGLRSFHMRSDRRNIIQHVFNAYGIEATLDRSVQTTGARIDLDNVDFETAARIVSLETKSFYMPLDAHRALVANDDRTNRETFMRRDVETVYLPGLTTAELTDMVTIAKNVFDADQAVADPGAGALTIRAAQKNMIAFNATINQLLDGHNQVLLDVRVIQLAHTNQRNTGITPPQTVSAFNVYSEEQSILNANQSLVQQIVSSGLAAPGDTLAILLILAASGQVSNSLFSNGFALFGGGLTASALSPGQISANINLNSSDSRELDQIQLRLGDGEKATIKSGTRYPIQTSSFSSIANSIPTIPGLTSAGSSGSLSSLLAQYSSVPNIPQVEYQDLGLTLSATPKVMRDDDVALTLDFKIDALAGSSLNGNPILNSRAYSGVVTLKRGETAAIVSELDKSETRSVSGTPGLSEIPGLNNLTGIDNQKSSSTLLIVITPHVVRGTQSAGHSPIMRVETPLRAR